MSSRHISRRLVSSLIITTGCVDSTQVDAGSVDGSTTSSGDDAGGEDCVEPIAGITLRNITAYQVVGVPLVVSGVPVALDDRIADIVAQRELLVRVDVDVDDDWQSQAVAASVEVTTNDHGTEVFATKLDVEQSSQPEDPTTSFFIEIPAPAVTGDANISVSLSGCGPEKSRFTTARRPRFPVTGRVALGARQTGVIKIHLVPIDVAGFVPETTHEIVDGFAAAVRAMYPVTDVELIVGDTFDGGSTVDMGELLVSLGVLRDEDHAPADVYYYGLVSGAEMREDFCPSCPTGTSEEAGQTHVGFAVGAAFGDALSESTLVHELGHMHGRKHSPCGDPSLLDETFPYPDGAIHVEGYDYRTGELIPPSYNDLMGYCQPRWVSDYTYRHLTEWVDRWNP